MSEPLHGALAEVLYSHAISALARSYAPYSRFRVAAALRASGGSITVGVNVENAAYPQSLCAERSAVVTAVSLGLRAFTDVAIAYVDDAGKSGGAFIRPCGGCLAVLHEFSPDGSLWVHCLNAMGEADVRQLKELLPLPFEFRASESGIGSGGQ